MVILKETMSMIVPMRITQFYSYLSKESSKKIINFILIDRDRLE